MNLIIVPHGTCEKQQKIFNLSHVAINFALKGKSKRRVSERNAKCICKGVIENGGVEVSIVENTKLKVL